MNKKLIGAFKKCIVSLLLVSVIIALACGCGNSKAGPYKEDDIVKIPIEVSENPGMIVAKIIVNYDASVLEYVECEDGFFTDNTVAAKDGTATCLLMADLNESLKDVTEKGTVATLVFKVKKGAAKGESLISVDEEASQYANISEKFVTAKVSVPEKIKIK